MTGTRGLKVPLSFSRKIFAIKEKYKLFISFKNSLNTTVVGLMSVIISHLFFTGHII